MRHFRYMKTAMLGLAATAYLGSLGACADAFGAAPADRHQDAPKLRVHFADLDLTRAAGAATLYSRIQSAARLVCAPAFVTREWEAQGTAHPCIDEVITRAVVDVNAPTLTRYHLAKMRQTMKLAEQQ